MGYDTTVDYVYDIGPSVYGMDDLHKFISYQKSLDNLNDYKRRDWSSAARYCGGFCSD